MNIAINEKPNGSGTSKVTDVSAQQCTSLANQLNVRGMLGGHYAENDGLRCWFKPHKIETDGSSTEMKPEILPSVGELGSSLISQFHFESNGSSKASKAESCKADTEIRDIYESLAQTNLSMTLATPIGNSNPFHSSVVDEREQSKTSSLLLGSRSRHLLPKPPRSTSGTGLEINAGMVSQIRVARPPAEGRGRNQLLPRYWPRITDQELQQISGEYPTL
ncbi:hypothetical protein V8G54_009344 [Vigna mungo]|uniref:Uncharacterized protein n=1 Tax=Vigna mungo TaxID=3915 RepID=A0AAQ3NWJ8_VIGMU